MDLSQSFVRVFTVRVLSLFLFLLFGTWNSAFAQQNSLIRKYFSSFENDTTNLAKAQRRSRGEGALRLEVPGTWWCSLERGLSSRGRSLRACLLDGLSGSVATGINLHVRSSDVSVIVLLGICLGRSTICLSRLGISLLVLGVIYSLLGARGRGC